ncbi:MAG: LysR family transcriptional regulator [Acidobacteriota bacterium]
MNLKNLRYFCAAYETHSTVAAARQCHVTQPVISNAIAQLEEELGVRLFTRQPRGLLPTAAAQRLFRLGGKLLADAQAVVETFQDEASHPRLSVRIHPAISIDHVQSLLRHIRREVSQLVITIPDDAQPVDAELTPHVCAPPGTAFMPLWDEQYVLAVPGDHPLAVQEQVSLTDLHGVAFIERTHCELASAWQAGLGEAQVVPDVRARVQTEEWALGLVAAGVGVTIAPVHAVQRRHDVVIRSDIAALQSVKRSIGWAYRGSPDGVLAEVLKVCEPGIGSTMAGFAGAVSSVG